MINKSNPQSLHAAGERRLRRIIDPNGPGVLRRIVLIRKDPANEPRLLAVDNPMVVPLGTVVRMQVIGNDVIHSFAVPALGFKIDAVPGRLNEIWFQADREGIYYGQCSQLCGQNPSNDPNDLHGHSFMPIEVHAVPPDKFAAWAAAAKSDLPGAYKLLAGSGAPTATVTVAGR